MKHVISLHVGLLVISLLGCQAHQNKPEISDDEHPYVTRANEYFVSVCELSEIIPPLCDELGISIEKNEKEPNRIKIAGTSLSGRQVAIEAEELVKGISLIQVTAKADTQVTARGLCDTVYHQIRDVINKYNRNKKAP